MLVLQDQEWFGEKCSFAHRQVDEQPTKRSKTNNDKSACGHVEEEWSARRHMATCCQPWQKSREIGETRYQSWYLSWVETRTCWTPIIEYTTLGLCLSRHEAAETYLTEEHRHAEPIQRVKFTKAIARHTKIRDQNPSLGYVCPGEHHQRSPNAPKFEDRSHEETEWQEQGAREAASKLAKNAWKIKGAKKSNILLTTRYSGLMLIFRSCEGCDVVWSDHAPQAEVAQGVWHGPLGGRWGGHQEGLEEEQWDEVENEKHKEEDGQLMTPTTSAHAWMGWHTRGNLEPRCDVNTVHQRAVRSVLRTACCTRPCAWWCSCHSSQCAQAWCCYAWRCTHWRSHNCVL